MRASLCTRVLFILKLFLQSYVVSALSCTCLLVCFLDNLLAAAHRSLEG